MNTLLDMNMNGNPRRLRAAALTLIMGLSALTAVGIASADQPKKTVEPLMTRDLAGISGKEAIVLTVEYAPGESSQPHRHDANVFVYVLEGMITMQVKGSPPVTLHPGQTYYESPSDIHTVSANASKTAPAKFLVFIVKDKGAPVTRAVTSENQK
ncbi:MAG: cupin domain-containing protein [Steroidobacteraceae bacterium]